jgi:hypothetical protein
MSFPHADWDTVERYAKAYPDDFPKAGLEEALREGLKDWELIGKQGTKGELQGFNTAQFQFMMKNKYSKDWHDRKQLEVSGRDGGPLETRLDISSLSLEQLEALTNALDAATTAPKGDDGQ